MYQESFEVSCLLHLLQVSRLLGLLKDKEAEESVKKKMLQIFDIDYDLYYRKIISLILIKKTFK